MQLPGMYEIVEVLEGASERVIDIIVAVRINAEGCSCSLIYVTVQNRRKESRGWGKHGEVA